MAWENEGKDFWQNMDVVKIQDFLNAGEDINARNSHGYTILHTAATLNANPEVIVKLVQEGANINSRAIDGATPLHSAANHNGNPEVITALLQAGALINAQDKNNGTPLHWAPGNTKCPEAIIMILLDAGANGAIIDNEIKTPFDKAISIRNTKAYWALNEAQYN